MNQETFANLKQETLFENMNQDAPFIQDENSININQEDTRLFEAAQRVLLAIKSDQSLSTCTDQDSLVIKLEPDASFIQNENSIDIYQEETRLFEAAQRVLLAIKNDQSLSTCTDQDNLVIKLEPDASLIQNENSVNIYQEETRLFEAAQKVLLAINSGENLPSCTDQDSFVIKLEPDALFMKMDRQNSLSNLYPNLPSPSTYYNTHFNNMVDEILVGSMDQIYPSILMDLNDVNLISDDNDSAFFISENDNAAFNNWEQDDNDDSFFTSIYDREMHAQQVNQLETLRALFNV